MKLKFGDFFGKTRHLGNDDIGFRAAKTRENQTLLKAFKSSGHEARAVSGRPGLGIVRGGAAGRFEASSFRKLHSRRSEGVGDRSSAPGPIDAEHRANQYGALSEAGGAAVAVAAEMAGQPLEAAVDHEVAARQDALRQAEQKFAQAWSLCKPAMGQWSADIVATQSVSKRAQLKIPADRALAAAAKAVEEMAAAGAPPAKVAAARKEIAEFGVQLALGIPNAALDRGGDQLISLRTMLEGLANEICLVADQARTAQLPDELANNLIPSLCARLASGFAAEHAATGEPSRIGMAFEAMHATASAILLASSPPREANGLPLLGRSDPALRPVLVAMRESALTRFLFEARQVQAQNLNLSESVRDELNDESSARSIATRIVAREQDAMVARQQLMNALRLEKLDIGVDLNNIKIDAALVQGLRKQFKGDAEKVGLVLAACYSLERSESAQGGDEGADDFKAYREAVDFAIHTADTKLTAARDSQDQIRSREQVAKLGHALENIQSFYGKLLAGKPEAQQKHILAEALRNDLDLSTKPGAPGHRQASDVVAQMPHVLEAIGIKADDFEQRVRDEPVKLAGEILNAALETKIQKSRLEADPSSGIPSFKRLVKDIAHLHSVKEALATTETRRNDLEAMAEALKSEIGELTIRQGARSSPALQALIQSKQKDLQAIERRIDHLNDDGLVGGLSQAELAHIGLTSERDQKAMLAQVEKFARMGLWGAAQAGSAVKTINQVAKVLHSGLNEEDATRRSNEALASALELTLLGKSADLDFAESKPADGQIVTVVENALPGVAEPDDSLTQSRDQLASLKSAHEELVSNPTVPRGGGPSIIDRHAIDYSERVLALQDQLTRLEALGRKEEEARGVITAHNAREGAKQLSLKRPEGLQASLALVRAETLLKELDSIQQKYFRVKENSYPQTVRQNLRRINTELAAVVRDIRGFDADAFKIAGLFKRGGIQTIEDLKKIVGPKAGVEAKNALLETANAIIFLRKGEIASRNQIEQASAAIVKEMDEIIAKRAQILGPEKHARVRDLIRAAVLKQKTESGLTIEGFKPADHSLAIIEQLAKWGLDTDRFKPEIDHQLSESFGVAELSLWAKQAEIKPETMLRPQVEAQPDERKRSEQEAIRKVDGLQPGSVLKFYGGRKIEAEVSVPVAGTGFANLSVGGKLEHSRVSNLEIERGRGDFTLTIRQGFEAVAGVDATVTLGKVFGSGLRGKLAVEGTGGSVDGYRLKFNFDADSPDGAQRLKAVMTKILAGEPLTADDLRSADDIAPSYERKGLVKGTATVSNKPKALQSQNWGGDSASNTDSLGIDVGGFVQFRVGASAEAGKEWGAENNTNEEAYADAFETTLQAFAGVTLRSDMTLQATGSAENPQNDEDIADNAFGQTVDLVAATKIKIKRSGTYDRDGNLDEAGMSREVRGGSIAGPLLARTVAGEGFRTFIDAPENTDKKAAFEDALKMIKGADILRFKYRMKADTREAVSGLIREARSFEERALSGPSADRKRLLAEAYARREAADKLVGNNSSYEPDKIQVIPFKQNIASWMFPVFQPFVRVGTFREEQKLYTAYEIKL